MRFNRLGRFVLKCAVLVVIAGALGGGAIWLHQHRRDDAAHRALDTGRTAYRNGQYTSAATHLGRYLTVDANNTEILLMYADAQIRRRPRDRESIQKAVNTW